MFKAVITDWDGVVLDSLRAHYDSVKESCRILGKPFSTSFSEYKCFLSRPVHYSTFYDDFGLDFKKNKDLIVSIYSRFMNDSSVKLFPGIIDLLKSLDCKKGLVTSSYRGIVDSKLGSDNVYDFIVCENDIINGKPHPEGLLKCVKNLHVNVRDAVYVGDTVTDAITAKNAGIKFIGVSYGYNTRKSLKACPNIGIADSIGELKKLLENIHVAFKNAP